MPIAFEEIRARETMDKQAFLFKNRPLFKVRRPCQHPKHTSAQEKGT